jgi:vitamin B12 transporter
MRSTFFYTAILAASLAAPAAHAANDDDEIVVTASRSGDGVRRDLLGASVTIFTPQDLEDRQVRAISDLLREVPGAAVSRGGGFAGQTQVRLRGSEANHTLVLIDGVEASDPFQGEFDYTLLNADDVARVEVLRGPQSALYGSDAIGGVVHYITATGAQAPGVRARAEYGSFDTKAAFVRAAGVNGPIDIAASASLFATNGTNIAETGSEADGFESGTLSLKAIAKASEALSFTFVGRAARVAGDTDPAPFGLAIDGPDHYTANSLFGLARADLSLDGGRWTHALILQGANVERRNFNAFPFFTDGRREKLSYEMAYRLGGAAAAQTVTFAADAKRETFRNAPTSAVVGPENATRRLDNVGFVLAYDLDVGGRFGLGLAARHDKNDHFKNADTYRAQASYRLDTGTRLRAAAGSGIKNPTNFELFGFDPTSFIANPNLKPERSEGWEAGVEQSFNAGALVLGATYFDETLHDEIVTLFTPAFLATPANLASTSTQRGVELTAEARLGPQWRLDAAYTRLDAKEAHIEEVRRPKNTASATVIWRAAGDRGGVALSARYNGKALDDSFATFPTTRVTLKSYTLVTLAADWRLTDTVQIYGRIENAADQAYEDVFSYGGIKRAAYIGLKTGF